MGAGGVIVTGMRVPGSGGALSMVKYGVNTEPGRVFQPPIPVDRGPRSDSIGTTFFESVKYVLIVDPHLSMTQAGE